MLFRLWPFVAVFFCIFSDAFAAPSVLVSIAPLHSVAAAVTEGVSVPRLLLNPSVSVHDYHLKPSDAAKLSGADILFWGGEGLESFLVKPVEAIRKGKINHAFLDDSDIVKLGVADDDGHFHESAFDPHFWLSAENMIVAARTMARILGERDPENAEKYAQNADHFVKRVRMLAENGKENLKKHKNKSFFVFHDAYRYFEKDFGLKAAGAVQADSHHDAGAGHLIELREKIKRAGLSCLFAEPQFSDKRIKVVREGLSVETGTLDPLGAHLPVGKDFYERLLTALIDSFSDCFERISKP